MLILGKGYSMGLTLSVENEEGMGTKKNRLGGTLDLSAWH